MPRSSSPVEILGKKRKWLGGKGSRWARSGTAKLRGIPFGVLVARGGKHTAIVMSGKVYHDASSDAELPAVGDWVALETGTGDLDHVIRARLSRQSCFSRKAPGKSSEEQVPQRNADAGLIGGSDAQSAPDLLNFVADDEHPAWKPVAKVGVVLRALVHAGLVEQVQKFCCEPSLQANRSLSPVAETVVVGGE